MIIFKYINTFIIHFISPYYPSLYSLHWWLSVFTILLEYNFSASIMTLVNQYVDEYHICLIDEWNENYIIDSTFHHNHIYDPFMLLSQTPPITLSHLVERFNYEYSISIYSIQFFNRIHSICVHFLHFTHDMIHSNRIMHDVYLSVKAYCQHSLTLVCT